MTTRFPYPAHRGYGFIDVPLVDVPASGAAEERRQEEPSGGRVPDHTGLIGGEMQDGLRPRQGRVDGLLECLQPRLIQLHVSRGTQLKGEDDVAAFGVHHLIRVSDIF